MNKNNMQIKILKNDLITGIIFTFITSCCTIYIIFYLFIETKYNIKYTSEFFELLFHVVFVILLSIKNTFYIVATVDIIKEIKKLNKKERGSIKWVHTYTLEI